MSKNLTTKRKTAGTFIRLTPELKKEAQIYALENGTNLTALITNALKEKIKS